MKIPRKEVRNNLQIKNHRENYQVVRKSIAQSSQDLWNTIKLKTPKPKKIIL